MNNAILNFRGKYSFLSNFYPSEIKLGNAVYPSVEHAYQAAKTTNKKMRRKIAQVATPAEAKRLGRNIVLRSDWEQIKVDVMFKLIAAKFNQNKELKQLLLATGNRKLIECNHWNDIFWGMCESRNGLIGENYLGKILMAVRKKLKDL